MNIIFDVGRVLCTVDLDIFTKEFNEIISPRVDYKFDGMDFLSTIQCAQDVGKTTLTDSLYEMFVRPNIISIKEMFDLSASWNNTISDCLQMTNLKDIIIGKSHKVAILSNMGTEHRNFIFKAWPQIFSNCTTFFSCDVGCRKPSKIFLYKFLEDHPEYNGALYVDDMFDNLDAGEEMGLVPYWLNIEEIYETCSYYKTDASDVIDGHVSSILKILGIEQ